MNITIKGVSTSVESIVGEKGTWTIKAGYKDIKVLSYNSCKKLFLSAGLKFIESPKLVCTPDESNKQQHIWLIGMQDTEWNQVYAEGEASRFNTWKITQQKNADGAIVTKYIEVSEIDAKYRSRMAYKRAFCRCVMDILWLEEYYSEDDSREFRNTSNGTDITFDMITTL